MGEKMLLKVEGVSKSFGTNRVLKDIDLSISSGEVLALIGGNGAGKSTLMKIMMGIYKPDSGKFEFNGEEIHSFKPSTMLEKGLYMVPQEPLLFPNMTVEENILIGFKENKSFLHNKLVETMKGLEWNIDINRKALSLSIAEQQIVELLRGMMREAKVLILDEPTSALTFDEVAALFKVVNQLREKGIGIIYITHRLPEVFTIATDVAIMKDGKITLQGKIKDFTKDMLVKGLLPDENTKVKECKKREKNLDYNAEKPVFELKGFSGYGFKDINLKVFPGEILGIAGLVGAGRTELATTIFGREKPLGGKAILNGKDITGLSTREVIKAGVNYVPEDRKLNGIFGIRSVAENMTSSLLFNMAMGHVFINKKKEKEITDKYITEFRTKVTGQDQSVGSLSGGNQQKVVIGRCLSSLPQLLILDEPTRGIDAAARSDVYSIISELRDKGVAIILISSDMEEIIELSDRVDVMFQGRITKSLEKDGINQNELMNASFDVKKKMEG